MSWSGVWNIKYNGADKEKLMELDIIKHLKKSEEDIENGRTIPAEKVFKSWEQNMDTDNHYKIEFTEECLRKMKKEII